MKEINKIIEIKMEEINKKIDQYICEFISENIFATSLLDCYDTRCLNIFLSRLNYFLFSILRDNSFQHFRKW